MFCCCSGLITRTRTDGTVDVICDEGESDMASFLIDFGALGPFDLNDTVSDSVNTSFLAS